MLLLLLLEVGEADAGWDLTVALMRNRAVVRRVIIHFCHPVRDIEVVLNCTRAWIVSLSPLLHHEITLIVSIGLSGIDLLGLIVTGQRRMLVLGLELIDAAVWGIFLKNWIAGILDYVHRAQHLSVTALVAIQVAGFELIQTDMLVRVHRHWNALPSRISFSHHLAVDLLLVFHNPHVWFFCGGRLHAHIDGLTARFLIASTAYATNAIALAHWVTIYHELSSLVVLMLCDRHVRLESSAQLVSFSFCCIHRKRADRITELAEVDLAYRRNFVHALRDLLLLLSWRLLLLSTTESIYGIVLWRAGCKLRLFAYRNSHLWKLRYHGQVRNLFVTYFHLWLWFSFEPAITCSVSWGSRLLQCGIMLLWQTLFVTCKANQVTENLGWHQPRPNLWGSVQLFKLLVDQASDFNHILYFELHISVAYHAFGFLDLYGAWGWVSDNWRFKEALRQVL